MREWLVCATIVVGSLSASNAAAQPFVEWTAPTGSSPFANTTGAYYTVLLLATDTGGMPVAGAALFVQLDGDMNWHFVGSTGAANSLGSGYPANLQGQRFNLSARLTIGASPSLGRVPGFRLKVSAPGAREVVLSGLGASGPLQRGANIPNQYVYRTAILVGGGNHLRGGMPGGAHQPSGGGHGGSGHKLWVCTCRGRLHEFCVPLGFHPHDNNNPGVRADCVQCSSSGAACSHPFDRPLP